ncbi:hypothetical protein imdm_905 [gamma proteobacterium IMCC2047]|nr:hypothetical protein imdm_905 [gamma proteobacterium IMCC2047]
MELGRLPPGGVFHAVCFVAGLQVLLFVDSWRQKMIRLVHGGWYTAARSG